MLKLDISDAKTQLSRYLERGETILLCRGDVPIAEIRPIPPHPKSRRPVGTDRGMVVPDAFFEPLPDDIVDSFEADALVVGAALDSGRPAK